MRSLKYFLILFALISFASSCNLTRMRYSRGFSSHFHFSGKEKKTESLPLKQRFTKSKDIQDSCTSNTLNKVNNLSLNDFNDVYESVKYQRNRIEVDTDTIIYYKRPKKIKPSKQRIINVDSLPDNRRNNPEDNNTKAEANIEAATYIFILAVALSIAALTPIIFLLGMIVVFVFASASHRFFNTYPLSTKKGRIWSSIMYYFSLVFFILEMAILLIGIIALIAFF
ncbi:MAG: hypothetical protein H7321_07160 [Bacteroidia bacterium]|nr:hypothetical protein [Bacteroidia bacterium]